MSLFQFYNPNPKGKLVGDCVKRCLTKATGEDYMSIQRQLNAIHRELGTRTYQDKKVYKAFVERRGYRKISFPAKRGEPRTTVQDVAEMQAHNIDDLRDYNIICNCAHHLVCVSEGQYWDTWNSGDKCVYNVWLAPINAASEVDQLKEQIEQKKQQLQVLEKELKKLEHQYCKLTGVPTKASLRKDFEVISLDDDPYGPCWIKPKKRKTAFEGPRAKK